MIIPFNKKPAVSSPREVFGYSDVKKQFNHVVTGAQLKMETFKEVDHSIYAVIKSLKAPLKINIEYPISTAEDISRILTAVGISLAENYPDIDCFIYQSTVFHPTLRVDKTINILSVVPVPTVLVYAQDKTGKKKYFLRQFELKKIKEVNRPSGWVRNRSYEEINKLDWFQSKDYIKKYILYDLPLNILWDTYNSTKLINNKKN
jgi:hypothetical protein